MKMLIVYDTSKATDNIVGFGMKTQDVAVIVDGPISVDGDLISVQGVQVGDLVIYSGTDMSGETPRPVFGTTKIKSVSPDVRLEVSASYTGTLNMKITRASTVTAFSAEMIAARIQQSKLDCGIETISSISIDAKEAINPAEWYVDLDARTLKRKTESFIYE